MAWPSHQTSSFHPTDTAWNEIVDALSTWGGDTNAGGYDLNNVGNIRCTAFYVGGVLVSPFPGLTSTVMTTVTISPHTYTAGATAEFVFLTGAEITSISVNGVAIPDGTPIVPLAPGGSVVVVFTGASIKRTVYK